MGAFGSERPFVEPNSSAILSAAKFVKNLRSHYPMQLTRVALAVHSEMLITRQQAELVVISGAPRARPPERRGAWGPASGGAGGSAGAKPPGSELES